LKSAIVYYTFGGSTKKEAERLSEELGAPVFRVMERHKRGLLGAFIPGCILAMRRRSVPIQPLEADLNEYDRIIIGCPVWAGYPAPAFNAVAELLPPEKQVEIFLCSGSGNSSKSEQGTRELIERKGCVLSSYRDVITAASAGKMKGGS